MNAVFYLGAAVAAVAVTWIATNCALARHEPAGMDHAVREAAQAALRRALGARPRLARHAGGAR